MIFKLLESNEMKACINLFILFTADSCPSPINKLTCIAWIGVSLS